MEILLAFAIGYAAGAKAGEQNFSDVVDAARAVRQSEEFHALIDALRAHAAATLRAIADVLSERADPVTAENLVERVVTLIRSSDARPT
jgi:hypothetical protein